MSLISGRLLKGVLIKLFLDLGGVYLREGGYYRKYGKKCFQKILNAAAGFVLIIRGPTGCHQS